MKKSFMKSRALLLLFGAFSGLFCLTSCGEKDSHLTKEIDSNYESKVDKTVKNYVSDEKIPSAVILAAKDGKVIFEKAYGNSSAYVENDFSKADHPIADKLESPVKAETDTIYDLASCTKIVGTTQAIMKLYYEKKLDVNDKVSKYLPDFAENGKDNVTIEQLLTHTSGLPQWKASFLYINNREDELEYIEDLPLIFEPGEVKYSDFGFMTLGYIVESITGEKLDEYVENEIFKPLGMSKTMYNPLDKGIKKESIAATSWGNPYEYRMVDEKDYPDFGYDCTEDAKAFEEFDGWRKNILIGQVNDGNTAMACEGIAGHAGIFSNVEDLAILGQLMLDGGSYNGVKLYDQETIDLFSKNHTGENNRGYGFEMNKSYMGKNTNENIYGHNGFTGTHIIINPEKNMEIIVLTNKQNSGINEEDGSYLGTFDFVGEISDIFFN